MKQRLRNPLTLIGWLAAILTLVFLLGAAKVAISVLSGPEHTVIVRERPPRIAVPSSPQPPGELPGPPEM